VDTAATGITLMVSASIRMAEMKTFILSDLSLYLIIICSSGNFKLVTQARQEAQQHTYSTNYTGECFAWCLLGNELAMLFGVV
jgi:hypothetical protein